MTDTFAEVRRPPMSQSMAVWALTVAPPRPRQVTLWGMASGW